jgi:uncharacterized membrane protein
MSIQNNPLTHDAMPENQDNLHNHHDSRTPPVGVRDGEARAAADPIADRAGHANRMSAPRWRRWLPLAGFLVLLALGAALRLTGITRQSLWLDEAYSSYIAAHTFAQMLAFDTGAPVHPPLYELVLHVWMLVGASPLAVRALSALASIATLVPLYTLARRIMTTPAALLATALLSVSSFQVWYAQEARMYALTQLAVLVALYGLVRFTQAHTLGAWALFTGAMLVALYMDYSAAYVLVGLVIWFALVGWRQAALRLPLILSGVALGAGFAPWAWVALTHASEIAGLSSWVGGSAGSGLFAVSVDLFFNRTNLGYPGGSLISTLAQVVSLALLAAAFWLPRRHAYYPLLALWAGAPLALGVAAGFVGHPILIARQMMVTEPALFLLLALAAESVWTRPAPATSPWRLPEMVLRPALIVVCLALFAASNVASQSLSWNTTVKEDWPAAAALVAAQQQNGDLILFDAYFAQMPFDYYYFQHNPAGGPALERGYGTQESLVLVNPTEVSPDAASGSDGTGYARVWLVVSHSSAPDAPDGSEAALQLLAQHYQRVQAWQFVGVTVVLYQAAGA